MYLHHFHFKNILFFLLSEHVMDPLRCDDDNK